MTVSLPAYQVLSCVCVCVLDAQVSPPRRPAGQSPSVGRQLCAGATLGGGAGGTSAGTPAQPCAKGTASAPAVRRPQRARWPGREVTAAVAVLCASCIYYDRSTCPALLGAEVIKNGASQSSGASREGGRGAVSEDREVQAEGDGLSRRRHRRGHAGHTVLPKTPAPTSLLLLGCPFAHPAPQGPFPITLCPPCPVDPARTTGQGGERGPGPQGRT